MVGPNFEVTVGTYEEYLLGYKLVKQPKGKSYDLVQNFATHGHTSSVRSLTTCGKYLASGGADDRIIVYDMNARKEHCMLTHNNGTVNCLSFTPRHSHLISGSADGVLSIVRVGNWQLEKLWEKAHKGSSILSIAVHDSGKLALTLGSDCVLRTWNLIKGRQAYAINLNSKCADPRSLEHIRWQPNGENFVLFGGANLELWSIAKGGMSKTFSWTSKLTSACFISDDVIVIGHENGDITVLNTVTEKQTTMDAHTKRVKCLESNKGWVVSGSSSGHVKLWRVKGERIEERGQISTGCRVTCLCLVQNQDVKDESDKVETAAETAESVEPVIARKIEKPRGVVIIETDTPKNKKKSKKRKKNTVAAVEEVIDAVPAVTPTKKRKSNAWTVENVNE